LGNGKVCFNFAFRPGALQLGDDLLRVAVAKRSHRAVLRREGKRVAGGAIALHGRFDEPHTRRIGVMTIGAAKLFLTGVADAKPPRHLGD